MAGIKGLDSSVYWPEKAKQAEPKVAAPGDNKRLDQKDFFSLLTQQLAYQDPSKPVDNAQMISQMSSFQTSDGISKLTDQFTNMNNVMNSSAALQASTLVGRSVLVPVSKGSSDGEGFSGVAIADKGARDVKVQIENAAGELMKTITLGSGEGNMKYSWDGTDLQGKAAPAGEYKVKVSAKQGDKNIELPAATYGHVSSVSLSGQGTKDVKLNLGGLGGFNMKDVLEVGEG